MESTKPNLQWLMTKMEACSDRYMDNEKFMLEYVKLPFWKRVLFGTDIIMNHLKKMADKYKF